MTIQLLHFLINQTHNGNMVHRHVDNVRSRATDSVEVEDSMRDSEYIISETFPTLANEDQSKQQNREEITPIQSSHITPLENSTPSCKESGNVIPRRSN